MGKVFNSEGEAKFVAGMSPNPELLDWYLKDFYQKIFYDGKVERRFKELGRLRLSSIHGCRSCNLGNRLDALEGGLTEAEIDQIHELDFDGFSEADRSTLRLADLMSMAAEPGSVLEHDLYDELTHHFSKSEILEMAMIFHCWPALHVLFSCLTLQTKKIIVSFELIGGQNK